jgi:hypothetical protein
MLCDTFWHAVGVVAVSAIIEVASCLLRLIFSHNPIASLYAMGVDTLLVIVMMSALGMLLISSVAKIVAGGIRSTWKGFLDGTVILVA